MAEHRTKRDILQEMLDKIAPGWIIMKPTADAPDSLVIVISLPAAKG